MKKSGILLTLTMLMLMVSCSDLWIVKRKYNRGYFIDLHHKEKVKVADQKRQLKLGHRAIVRSFQPNEIDIKDIGRSDVPLPVEHLPQSAYVVGMKDTAVPVMKVTEFAGTQQTALQRAASKSPSVSQRSIPVHRGKTASVQTKKAWKRLSLRVWITGLGLMLVIHLFLQRILRQWSRSQQSWAAQNRRSARWLIGVFTTASAFFAMSAGHMAHAAGFEIGPEMLYLGYGLGGGTIAASFLGSSRSWKRKWLWPMMLLSGTAMSVPAGYYHAQKAPELNVLHSMVRTTKLYTQELYQHPDRALKPETTHRIWSRDMKRSSEVQADDPGMTAGKAFVIIFFISVIFLFLQYFILMYSCSLSCSGYEFAANLLLFGGSALSMSALVYGIIKVARKRFETKQWEQEQSKTPVEQ